MTFISRKTVTYTFIIILTGLFLLFLGNLIFSTQCYASVDAYISNDKIDILLNPDGSAEYTETQTYSLGSSFSSIDLDIDNTKSAGLTNPRVLLSQDGKLIELKRSKSSIAHTFNFLQDGQSSKFKVFEPSSNKEKTLVFMYKLHDTVTKYKDIAEFNQKLLGPGFTNPRKNILAKITLPKGASKNELKAFSQAPFPRECKILDEKTIEISASSLNPGSILETTILFPTRIVPISTNIKNINALAEIINREEKIATDLQKAMENAKVTNLPSSQASAFKTTSFKLLLLITLLFFWSASMIVIYFKYDRGLRSFFKEKYFRELPGKYSPAEMSYLIHNRKTSTLDFLATLIDLVRRGIFKIDVQKALKDKVSSNSPGIDYIFSPANGNLVQGLKAHEEKLITMFYDFGGLPASNAFP